MGLTPLTERSAAQIAGVLSCWDRILLSGTPPKICFAEGMTSYLYEHKTRIFDYPKFAEPFRGALRENAERLAAENGMELEFLRKRKVRKQDRVKTILAKRGDHAGLVCILPAMEPRSTGKPRRNKQTGKTCLPPDGGKCLHYCFYFIDKELRLGYVRVPARLPCRLQADFNGHGWLASVLRKRRIELQSMDNTFVERGGWKRAQQIADGLEVRRLHHRPDEMARRFCPIHRELGAAYHWSMDQCEYATDIVFRRQADLGAIYGNPTRTAIHTVKPDDIATFLGRQLSTQHEGEMGDRSNIRIQGTRIKHTMGPVSLKLCDKFGLVLRLSHYWATAPIAASGLEVPGRSGMESTLSRQHQQPLWNGSGCSPRGKAAADEFDDFQRVAVTQDDFGPFGPANDFAVQFDGDALRIQCEIGKQAGDREAGGSDTRDSIDSERDLGGSGGKRTWRLV
jgi:hypothetical protein